MAIDFNKKLKEAKAAPIKTSHPPLGQGYTRVFVEEIKASTDKAVLFLLDGRKEIWIPRKIILIHYPRVHPIHSTDGKTVVDIANWFYDKHLNF